MVWEEGCREAPSYPIKSSGSKGHPALGGVSGQRPEKPGTGFRAHGFAPLTSPVSRREGLGARVVRGADILAIVLIVGLSGLCLYLARTWTDKL